MEEKIDACIFLERKSAEIYRSLSELFPEAAHIFAELAKLEESHARKLQAARTACLGGSAGDANLSGLLIIRESLRIAEHFKSLIQSRGITLCEASAMSVFFHESIGETYFEIVMNSETDSEIISKLVELYFEEERYITILESFQKGACSTA